LGSLCTGYTLAKYGEVFLFTLVQVQPTMAGHPIRGQSV